MDFFETKFWKSIRKNEKLYNLIHNSLGKMIRDNQLKDRKIAIKNDGFASITEIDKTLSAVNCVHFVDFGTLLGFVREGKLLAWDFDVDFGVKIDNGFTWQALGMLMNSISFSLVKQFSFHGVVTEQTYARNGVFVDFFRHFDSDSGSYYYVYFNDTEQEEGSTDLKIKVTTTVRLTETAKLPVEGGVVSVPKEYEQYLVDVYGENWRVPDPDWKPAAKPNVRFLEEPGTLTEFKE